MSDLNRLYIMRYRIIVRTEVDRGLGLTEAFVEGADIEEAERVGRAHCLKYGHSFLEVRPGLVANTSILTPVKNAGAGK